jgi:hypothetical protein
MLFSIAWRFFTKCEIGFGGLARHLYIKGDCIARTGFEPVSWDPESYMIDRYTTGLFSYVWCTGKYKILSFGGDKIYLS